MRSNANNKTVAEKTKSAALTRRRQTVKHYPVASLIFSHSAVSNANAKLLRQPFLDDMENICTFSAGAILVVAAHKRSNNRALAVFDVRLQKDCTGRRIHQSADVLRIFEHACAADADFEFSFPRFHARRSSRGLRYNPRNKGWIPV